MSQSIVSVIEAKLNDLLTLFEKLKSQANVDRKADVGELPHRVIHLKKNPSQVAVDERSAEFEKLKKDNTQLKARLEILQSCSAADLSNSITSDVNSSELIIHKLRSKVEVAKLREEKLVSAFKKSAQQYREACYLITGWKIDVLKDGLFRLSNMYAEMEQDQLLFEISPDGEIQLLENEYTKQLKDYITTYLVNGHSFPAFLASITMNLFKSTTQNPCMSMVMM